MAVTPRVLVLLPTYNEAANVEALVEELLSLKVPGLAVLVVDDMSPDGTGERVRALSARRPEVRLLERGGPRGRGHAGREGFLAALESGAALVVEMDADFSHRPQDLPALLAAMEECDVAIGSRLVAGGSDVDRGWGRRALTLCANAYARLMLGLRVGDVNSGYRCFSREALEAVRPATLRSSGPSILHETLFRAARAGLRAREVPIAFIDRKRGSSKLDWRKLASGYWWVLKLRLLGSE